MLKKLLAFLLVASMLMFTLGACSSSDSGSSTTTAADAEGDTTVGETTEEATEAPTEAPTTEETTEAVTEAPKTYSYTEVFKLDFTTMADGTAPFNPTNVDDIRIEGGLLKGTGTSGDPYFNYTGELALDASTVQEIHIKLKNYSSSYDTQFFFTTETIGWAEEASFKNSLDWCGDDGDDNDWNEIICYTDECSEWTGTVTSFRIDPSGAEGDFEIESITFYTVTEDA